MEKKPTGRPLQTPGKGVGTDSKKVPDGNNGKLFPKTSRRRESNGTPNSAKYEPNRKPVPQKSKTIDKRPRPRGQYSACGKEDSKVVEDQEAEIGSVFIPGSKKQNLNHLLNFHYAPRDNALQWRSVGGQRWSHASGNRNSGILAMSNHRHKYNKEQYLQANCQFVVKADGDYSPYSSNPDTLVDWDLVEQIRVQGPEVPSCPICLYPPVAAKMTRCGHVYCWPCILHYLALSDKSWRKCPICFEAVHKQDLKSVVALPCVACNIEEEIEMRLMCREKGSLVVTPVEEMGTLTSTSDGLPLSVPASVYSKLILATPLQVLSIVDREKAELKLQLSDETNSPEVCFTEQAIELLSERETSLIKKSTELKRSALSENASNYSSTSNSFSRNINLKSEAILYVSAFDNVTADASTTPGTKLPKESGNNMDIDDGKCDSKFPLSDDEISLRFRNESISSEGLGSEEDGNWENSMITAEDLELAQTNQSRLPSCSPSLGTESMNKYYYFYQAADGQHIYLHSLNVRMLERGFGSLENCPQRLRGRVLEKEAGSMTLELRKRLRCFQHLPLACQFEVAEIQLEPPLVSKETMNHFRDQLEYRHRRRQKRAREEQRWEKRAAQEEARKLGHFPSPQIRIDSHHQFPRWGLDACTPYAFRHDNKVSRGGEPSNTNMLSNVQEDESSLTDALDGLRIGIDSGFQNEPSESFKEEGEEESAIGGGRDGCVGKENPIGGGNMGQSTSPSGTESGIMSFAQMLREGKGRVSDVKNWGTKKPDNEGKAALLMAAASKAATAASKRQHRSSGRGFASEESDAEAGDNQGMVPNFSESFGDAIALALSKKENVQEVASAQGQKKKKKRQKQKLLFNTNMAFVGK